MIVKVDTYDGITEAGRNYLRKGYEFLKKNHPDISVEWLTHISGKYLEHFAVWHFASLADYETCDMKLNADQGLKKVLKEASVGPLWSSHRVEFYKVQE